MAAIRDHNARWSAAMGHRVRLRTPSEFFFRRRRRKLTPDHQPASNERLARNPRRTHLRRRTGLARLQRLRSRSLRPPHSQNERKI